MSIEIKVGDILCCESLNNRYLYLTYITEVTERSVNGICLDGGNFAQGYPTSYTRSGVDKCLNEDSENVYLMADVLSPSAALPSLSNKCTCPMRDLLMCGCKCGGV